MYTGSKGWVPSRLHSTFWYEAIPPGQMAVPDLYLSMLATRGKRLSAASNGRRLSTAGDEL